MTVSTTTIKNSYSGNGSATAFNYTFKIFASSELKVYIRTTATGAETLKTVTTHYTVSGIGDTGGGTVTFTSGNVPTSAQQVILVRDTPLTQSTDYVENDPFPASSHEDALDKLTHQMQEQQEELDRSFKVSKTVTDLTSSEVVDDAATRASKLLGFSSNGASFAYYSNPDVDAEVTAIGGLTSAANKMIRYTGSGTADLIDYKDEDDMDSNSASAVASQQSVKAYVDSGTATLTNKTLTAPKFADGGFIADANGNELIKLETTSSAVNELSVTNAAAGNAITLSATGGDTNIDIDLTPKGSGEINIAAGNLNYGGTAVTSTGAELNILDGVTATASELNILDGVTATATELNLIDGVTATTAELNYSDTGAAVGTVVASKVVTADANKDVASFRNITLTGELDAGSLDVSGDADIDGTLEADAMTLNGTAITDTATLSTGISNNNVPKFTSGVADNDFLRVDGTAIEGRSASEVLSDIAAAPAAGSSNVVTTGALNSGSITSGFGAIDNGSSNITTTGDISGGTLNATSDTSAGDNAAIGYTSTEGIVITGQGSTNDITLKRDDDTAVLEVATGQSDIEITGGNIFFGTANKGIYLGVTSATAANLLDDYEEGTWTATLTGSTSNPSSAVTVTGNYTKTGNLVWVQANFGGVNSTGSAGAIRVTGLPFTPSPGSQHSGSASVHTGATIASGVCNISPSFESSYITFYASTSEASWAEITHNEAGAMWLYFSGIYKT
tara:strand:- start:433 stop:2643 length:2211 start_codon:yes stop_codon:yes gene_type:complete